LIIFFKYISFVNPLKFLFLDLSLLAEDFLKIG
jgi:hypothetical protein